MAGLREGGITEIHICGIDTEGCVLKTAVDLFDAGVRPVVLVVACASTGGDELHRIGLRTMRRLIGERQC